MCSCDDVTSPSAFRQIFRTARKDHKCCECGETISRGDRYEYSSGVWDGVPSSYKTCLQCMDLRDAYTLHTDCCAAFRELRSMLQTDLCTSYSITDLARDIKVNIDNLRRLIKEDE